jgi:hypothetical protein
LIAAYYRIANPKLRHAVARLIRAMGEEAGFPHRDFRLCNIPRVIPEIDIWRTANLMLRRYGEKALEESAARADELTAQDDYNGQVVSRRITDAVTQLANMKPAGRPH